MATSRDRLQSAIGKLIENKADKVNYISALVGTYDESGIQVVDVENRLGFVYCRIGGDYSETVEVFNETTIFPEFDLKVLIYKDVNSPYYKLYGRDLAQYSEWDNTIFLPFHGNTHSFGSGDNEGNDPVFIWKRQLLQPLGVHPTFTGTKTVSVEPDYYTWNNQLQYFEGAESDDFSALIPSSGGRFVTIYLDGGSNSLKYKTGDVFNSTFYSSGLLDFVPTITPAEGIPLASIFLQFDVDYIDWEDIFDLRNFLNQGGEATTQVHGLDPIDGYHSGTLRASVVTVADTNNYFTGTVVEDVLVELFNRTGGGAGSGVLPIFDNSVFKVTGTAVSFDNNLDVVVTGSVVYVSSSGTLSLYTSPPADVGAIAVTGSSLLASPGDHVHRGIRSVKAITQTELFGDVIFASGSNTVISQAGQTITINAVPTVPGGSDFNVQFANGGVFAGNSGFTFVPGSLLNVPNLAIAASLRLTGDITPAQITSDQNDYNPSGFNGVTSIRLSSDAARNITGLGSAGDVDGRTIILHNVGSFNITLVNQSASSTASSRFIFPSGDVVLLPDMSVILWYDITTARWRRIE